MGGVESLRDELEAAMQQAESWISRLVEIEGDFPIGHGQGLLEDARTIGSLRSRAASALINIAFMGAFSSGKTFLLSGLQGGLEYTQVSVGDGQVSDKYIGLLPSAPTPTTTCPTTVVPVGAAGHLDAGGRGFLRVHFADNKEWADVGNSLSPVVVAAYTMAEADVTGRLDQHWNREVAEVELLISEYRLPAKLHDLPGYGSPNAIHEAIMRGAMADADCFLYVASATRTLAEDDLELIRVLYQHHKNSGGSKRVVWVVTAIDRAIDLQLDNRPAWQATVDRNNRYLRDHFVLPDGRPDQGFIGGGFIPVSPAFEARGRRQIDHGDSAGGRRLLAMSQMDELRTVLNAMIGDGTGRRHIADIASEAWTILAPHYRRLADTIRAQRLPLDQLVNQRSELGERLRDLDRAVDANRSRLESRLQTRLRAIDRSFEGLQLHLHGILDAQILQADLRKPREANGIEVRKTQVIRDWMTGTTGASTVADAQLASFADEVLFSVRAVLQQSDPGEMSVRGAPVDVEELLISHRTKVSSIAAEDIVQRAAIVVGAVAPLVTPAAAALGVVSGGMLFVPLGVAAAAVVLYGAVWQRKRTRSSLEVLRQEWIADLDDAASRLRQSFLQAQGLVGSMIIARAQDIVTERRDQVAREILIIEERLGDPEAVDRQNVVEFLEPHCKNGGDLLSSLKALSRF
jgi:hypothetical protein